MDFDALSKFLGQVGYLAHRLEEFTFELQGTVDQMRKSNEPEPQWEQPEPFVAGMGDDAKLEYIANNHPGLQHMKDEILNDVSVRTQLKNNQLWMDSAYEQAKSAVRERTENQIWE